MLCTGIGTEFTPVDLNLKGYGIVIVKPGVSVPTALAYSRVTPAEPTVRLADKISAPPTQWQGQVKMISRHRFSRPIRLSVKSRTAS